MKNNEIKSRRTVSKKKLVALILVAILIAGIPLAIVTSQYLSNNSDAWKNQVGLKKWSDKSKQIVVDAAGHAVHWTHPNVVNREILKMLDMKNSKQDIP